MPDWKGQLDSFNHFLEELRQNREQKAKLRFECSFVIASDIAQQFFCEKKVEMEYLHGEVETEAKTIGTEAHEKLTEGSVKVDREQLWHDIYGDKPTLFWRCFYAQNTGMYKSI